MNNCLSFRILVKSKLTKLNDRIILHTSNTLRRTGRKKGIALPLPGCLSAGVSRARQERNATCISRCKQLDWFRLMQRASLLSEGPERQLWQDPDSRAKFQGGAGRQVCQLFCSCRQVQSVGYVGLAFVGSASC